MQNKVKGRVGVIGLGFVGLPLASLFAKRNYEVVGIDVDQSKIDRLKKGESYVTDVSNTELSRLIKNNRLSVSNQYTKLQDAEIVVVCAPTPLTKNGTPDLSYVTLAAQELEKVGLKGKLLIFESSSYPGTTEEALIPILEKRGLKAGSDFHVAYSPERINPGDRLWTIVNIPKVISGYSNDCLKKATDFYDTIFDQLVPVSTIRAAEMVKVMENTQRFVNISFVNEMAQFCYEMDIDIWEVVEAIATKPGFSQSYYPGPGVGGHCIPVDPIYLDWKAKQIGKPLHFTQLAKEINDRMPRYIVDRVKKLLASKKSLKGKSVLVIGVTYKKDVNDLRESPALSIISLLQKEGAVVQYHDPLAPEIRIERQRLGSKELTPRLLASHDCVLILTDHSALSISTIISHSNLILDTKNIIASSQAPHVFKL